MSAQAPAIPSRLPHTNELCDGEILVETQVLHLHVHSPWLKHQTRTPQRAVLSNGLNSMDRVCTYHCIADALFCCLQQLCLGGCISSSVVR